MLYFVQNDTMPQIKIEIKDEYTGEAKDLTNCEVKLWIKSNTNSSIIFGKSAVTGVNLDDNINGICYIQWLEGELNKPGGVYTCEIEIYDKVLKRRQTIYDTLELTIREDISDIPPVSVEPTV